MKSFHSSVIILTGALMLLGCEKENPEDFNTVIGSGEVVSQSLELAQFSDITLEGVASLYVTLGEEQSVQVRAQQNILEVLNWEVTAGRLIISTEENIRLENHKEIRFDIVVEDLYSLLHSGVGDIRLEGQVRSSFEIDYWGVGNINAYDLPVNNCIVNSDGIGDCKLRVNDSLVANIQNLGNIYYRGNPAIDLNNNGMGNLVNDN